MEKAKKKVIDDGYNFAKGKSRSKLEESGSPSKKTPKLSSEERTREIESLQETIKILNNCLMFKNQQLQKEMCMNNYMQCDKISAEILEVKKEKKSVDRQLTVLVKKEAKAQWYLNSDKSQNSSLKKNKVRDNQAKLPGLFKQDSTASSTSTNTDDTIILSDSDDQRLIFLSDSEEGQNSPQSPLLFDETTHTAINEDSQLESGLESSRTPIHETTRATINVENEADKQESAPDSSQQSKQDFCQSLSPTVTK